MFYRFILSLLIFSLHIKAVHAENTKVVQELLSQLGYEVGSPDGIAGVKTFSAIKLFYSDIKGSFDGVIDENEIATLKKAKEKIGALRVPVRPDELYIFSNLRELKVPKRWSVFRESDLQKFHEKHGIAVESYNRNVKNLNCEKIIKDFELSWSLFDDVFPQISTNGQNHNNYSLATYGIHLKCRQDLVWKHFKDRNKGIKVFERALLNWSSGRVVKYTDQNLKEREKDKLMVDVKLGQQAYTSASQIGTFSAFYAMYFDDFNYTIEERQAVESFLSNWIIENDIIGVGSKLEGKICNTRHIEKLGELPHKKSSYMLPFNNCGSVRLQLALGGVLLGMRTNNQELFSAGNRHLEVALAAIDRDGVFVPWAKKGAMALGYQRQLPEVLTILATAYESIGYDFYEHITPNGKKIHEVYQKLFDFIYKPKMLSKYAKTEPKYAGTDFYQFSSLKLEEQWRRQLINLNVLGQQSMGYILRYKPELIHLLDFQENWSTYWRNHLGIFTSISGLVLYQSAHADNKEEVEKLVITKKEQYEINRKKKEEAIRLEIWGDKGDLYSGTYSATWYLTDYGGKNEALCRQNNDKGMREFQDHKSFMEDWEKDKFCAKDIIYLRDGVGKISPDRFYDVPEWKVREKLEVTYRPNGEIEVWGDISLWDVNRKLPTRLVGTINSDKPINSAVLKGLYPEGNKLTLKLLKISDKQIVNLDKFEGSFLVGWYMYSIHQDQWDQSAQDVFTLKDGKGEISLVEKLIDDYGPSGEFREKVKIQYSRGGDIVIYGNLDHNCLDGESIPFAITGNIQDEFLLDKKKNEEKKCQQYKIKLFKLN